MRRLPIWILCLSLAYALAAPVRHAAAQSGTTVQLRIGERYRGPDLGFYNEPRVVSVRGRSGVYYVRDSEYDVYRYGSNWYMNYDGDWYRASSYSGPWVFVGYRSVPRVVTTVPARYRRNWNNPQDVHYTYRNDGRRYRTVLRIGDRYRGPNLGFYEQPSMIRVPGTRIFYTHDSDVDVYRHGNYWYMNYSGDWYRASSYRGPWTFVGYRSVPQAILSVPTQYRRTWSDYRDKHYDWRGTAADDGVVEYSGTTTLRIGDPYRGPALTFYDNPEIAVIPGARGVYYVRDSDYDIYRYGNTWFMNYNGDWYRASGYRGPWTFVGYRSVPRDVYTVPVTYRRTWRDYRDVHYNWGN